MELDKVKIGILGGGVSAEREISLESAQGVYTALKRKKLPVCLIDIDTAVEEEVKKIINSNNIDVAFIALHGEFGEDGKIQSILEDLNLVYTGSRPKASAIAMDKAQAKEIFLENGIPTAKFAVYSQGQDIPMGLKYPLVVKPLNSGSSLGVSIVKNESSLELAIEQAFSYHNKIIIEDYIKGREVSVGILGEQAQGVVEIIAKRGYYDFKAKYDDVQTEFIAPAQIKEAVYKEIQKVGLAAHKSLGCRHFSRVDLRLNEQDKPYVLEVNSIPGLTSHSLLPLSVKVYGMSYDNLIFKMLELALYGKKTPQKV